MPDTVTLVTPDHIELEFQLAGLGTRFTAIFLDHLFQLVAVMFFSFMLGALSFSADDVLVSVILLFGLFFLIFGYVFLFEWLWNGQTPGKKISGLRVIRDDGRPLDFSSAAVRNIVRIADFLPAAYGVGVISIFANPKLKRLGDLAAGTLVVVERRIERQMRGVPTEQFATPAPSLFPMLNKEDREAAIRFLSRRHGLSMELRRQLGYKITIALAERAGYNKEDALKDPEGFLELVARSE